jgi:small ligand-binding sensory domain FIST
MKKVATSIVLGNAPSAELAAKAVSNAMRKADISVANSVLLFLTSEFASAPQTAIKAAAKAANCTQVMGCSASGIFTEEDWVLDAPAAAAMVFGGDITLVNTKNQLHQAPLLTLTAPNGINSTWLNNGQQRYGGVSGDAIGQGPFSVWQNAKGDLSGHIEAYFSSVKVATACSHGLQMLNQPQQIERVNQFDLLQLSQQSALSALEKAWKFHSKSDTALPLHMLMAVYADSAEGITSGQFNQASIIACDADTGSITLAQPLKVGQFVSWCLRDNLVAESDMLLMTDRLASSIETVASFGLMFSCLGRGPYFYDGIDRDLEIVKHTFPNMPLLGFYGNGEIAYINGHNQLLPYSAVLSLFSSPTIHET